MFATATSTGGSGSFVASPSRTSIATAFAAAFAACGFDRGSVDVDAEDG